MKVLLTICLVLAFLTAAFAASGDFAELNFMAAAPSSYNHKTGGGAVDDQTSNVDTVESLEGGDYFCNDFVTFLLLIRMETTVKDAKQDIRVKLSFTATTTGQPGVAFVEMPTYNLNCPTCSDPAGDGPNNVDSAVRSNGNEVITVHSSALTGIPFTAKATLDVDLTISNLEANENVVLRTDIRIGCLPGLEPTGNLQGSIVGADWKTATNAGGAIPVGAQTVPMKSLSNIIGIACDAPAVPIVGNHFTATVTVVDGNGVSTYTMYYDWDAGAYKMVDSNDLAELYTFDSQCSYNQDGEVKYFLGGCGCEPTKIYNSMVQLFFDSASGYYNTPGTVEGNLVHYTISSSAEASITDLWVDANNYPVKAQFVDGTIWNFQVTSTAAIPSSTFTLSSTTECECMRRIDLVMAFEISGDTYDLIPPYYRAFATAVANDFVIDPSHTNIGVMGYGDATPIVWLSVVNGTSPSNVQAGINQIDCNNPANQICGFGTGSLLTGMNQAVTQVKKSTRSFTSHVVVIVTNGWPESTSTLDAAIPVANDVTFIVVAYDSLMQLYQLQHAVKDTNYLIQRWTHDRLATESTIDVASLACSSQGSPCGDSCCGACDETCGTCGGYDECIPFVGCSISRELVGLCCVETAGHCDPPPGFCGYSQCDAQTETCNNVETCEILGAGDQCNTYQCSNGSCIVTSTLTSGKCWYETCNAGSKVNNTRPLPANTACTTWSCDPNLGFVGTATADPNPLSEPLVCTYRECRTNGGWQNVTVYEGCQEPAACQVAGGCPPDANKCLSVFCNVTVCQSRTTTCSAPDLCSTAQCNPTTGNCDYAGVECTPSDACHTSACDLNSGACVESAVECASVDMCTNVACDPNQGGACVRSPVNCDDGYECTDDTCEPATGCVNTPVDAKCNLNDPCRTFTCTATGCEAVLNPCTDDGKFCTNETCVPFSGCSVEPLKCEKNDTAEVNCDTAFCDEDNKECGLQHNECASDLVGITAGVLSAGVIVGIVIAAIVGAALGGGGAYAVYQNVGTVNDNVVTNNPLYQGNSHAGENPLHNLST